MYNVENRVSVPTMVTALKRGYLEHSLSRSRRRNSGSESKKKEKRGELGLEAAGGRVGGIRGMEKRARGGRRKREGEGEGERERRPRKLLDAGKLCTMCAVLYFT